MILGSGIDVVELERIERALERYGSRFERKVFHEREIRVCRRLGRPALGYALRFAAKEAVMKALGTGWARGVRWADIEVREPERAGGQPNVVLHGTVARLARARGELRIHLAASRDRRVAVALVLLEGHGA